MILASERRPSLIAQASDGLQDRRTNLRSCADDLGQHLAMNMTFGDLEKSALQLNELYEQLEIRRYGRVWTTQELALGFVGDMGDLAKLIQAHTGVRDIDDCRARLGHELSDCLWSIMVLANKCGVDLEAEFVRNMRELSEYVSGELRK